MIKVQNEMICLELDVCNVLTDDCKIQSDQCDLGTEELNGQMGISNRNGSR